MEEHNDLAEYLIHYTMFNDQEGIKMVNRYDHLNPDVYETLEILQNAVDDIAIEVSLKAGNVGGSPPFLTLSRTRRGNIDAGRVLHCISQEGLGDPELVAQLDSEICNNNNANLQFFVFFNMFEGRSRYGQIVQLNKPKVIKLGLTKKEIEMIVFIMEYKDTEALAFLFPYIPANKMQDITDRLQVALTSNLDKVSSRTFGTYIDKCVRKNYHRLVNDYDMLREPFEEY